MSNENYSLGYILKCQREGNEVDKPIFESLKTRMEGYEIALKKGIVTKAEIRELEGLPPIEGES